MNTNGLESFDDEFGLGTVFDLLVAEGDDTFAIDVSDVPGANGSWAKDV